MPDDPNPGADVAALAAQLSQAKADAEAHKARVREVTDEARGHRLNADKARADLEKAAAARDEAVAEAARKVAEAETKAAAALTAAEEKAKTAETAAQLRSIRADLRIAAKDAGAQDVSDALTLLDMSKVKLNDAGDVENAAELIEALKKAKPYLFGGQTTSSTTPPPPQKPPAPKSAKDMTDDEFETARKARAWRS